MNIWTRHRQLKSSWGTFPLTASYEKQSAHQNVKKKNKQKNNFVAIFIFFKKRETWQFDLIQFLPFMPLRLTTTHVKQLIKPEGNTWNGFSLSEENDDWF